MNNYDLEVINGTLTIVKREIVIQAYDHVITQGDNCPTLDYYIVSGIVEPGERFTITLGTSPTFVKGALKDYTIVLRRQDVFRRYSVTYIPEKANICNHNK
jgi:hypothetical protein